MPIRRYRDDDVATAFGKDNILILQYNAGTAFLENTFGMHKGQLPKTENRLLLQIQYSLYPIGIYKYTPITTYDDRNLNIDPYINRLYKKNNKKENRMSRGVIDKVFNTWIGRLPFLCINHMLSKLTIL